MTEKRLPRPRDPLVLAKRFGDIATGQIDGKYEDGKNASATIREVQAMARDFILAGSGLVDELIAERHVAAERE